MGHRGVVLYKDGVYVPTPDDHLVCLNARDGTVKWNVALGDVKQGYWMSVAPLIVRDHLLVGLSGDFDNLPGMLKSIDPDTGREQWTFYTTPPPGTPASPTAAPTRGNNSVTGP